jgi:hypothetical protein
MAASAPGDMHSIQIIDAGFSAPLQALNPEPSLTDLFWDRRAAAFPAGSGAKVYQTQALPSGDITDPSFDFVRSIKVWQFDYTQEQGRDACIRRGQSRLGTYDFQGRYTWVPHTLRSETIQVAEPDDLNRDGTASVSVRWDAPISASIHEADVNACDRFQYRAVVATWSDYLGNLGFHEARY